MPGTISEPQDPPADQEMADVDADVNGPARTVVRATAAGNGHHDTAMHSAEEEEDDDVEDEERRDDAEQNPDGENDDEGFDEPQRIRILPGSTDTAASFQFDREDHTLGNALRYIIMKNPVVEFCGYTIPHPAEDKMNLRIQTWDDASVYDVLEKGLDDLMDLCDVVTEKFTIARDNFRAG